MTTEKPLHVGVVDTGTTAIRVLVARVHRANRFVVLHKERWPICLGADVFSGGVLSPETMRQTTEAFDHFAELFERHGVVAYRAVATSALRQAKNGDRLLEQVTERGGLDLQIISGVEEALLTGEAIRQALGSKHLELVLDIGGGSLELLWFHKDGEVADVVSLPLGTVRLKEQLNLQDVLDEADLRALRGHVNRVLEDHGIGPGERPSKVAVGAGGNVDDLADVFGGKKVGGYPSLDLVEMSQNIERITALTVRERMARFGVRRDRAELMSIAGVVLACVGEWLGIERLGAPDVGVRDGLVARFCRELAPEPGESGEQVAILESCRFFARRFHGDQAHAEHVRILATKIFDELVDHHQMGQRERLILECAAVLHDIGNAVEHGGRHKQGVSLIEKSELHGLHGRMRDMVTVVVRHHRSAFPASRHSRYKDLAKSDRALARKLAAILRVADGLDTTQRQYVDDLQVETIDGEARFLLAMDEPSALPAIGAEQKCHLFELAFSLRPRFELAEKMLKGNC